VARRSDGGRCGRSGQSGPGGRGQHPGWASGVQVAGGQVYLADGPAGLAMVSLPTAPVTIVAEPQAHPVFYGSPGTLTVVAYSAGPINYQWYQGQSGDSSHPVAGATSAVCTIPALTESAPYWVRVSSGANSFDSSSATLVVAPLALWGDTSYGLSDVPGGLTNPVAIAAGKDHLLALTAQGHVLGWGGNDYGQTTLPSGLSNVAAIAAGPSYSLALTAEGRVVGGAGMISARRLCPAG